MNLSLRAAASLATIALACAAAPADAAPTPPRDGSHDFDFNLGTWRTAIVRKVDPLSSSDAMVRMTGTVKITKLWNGRAQVEEIEADGPKGSHWEGMTVFLYNPKAREWSQNFAGGADGRMTPPTIGRMVDGRIELHGADTFDGRPVKVRGVWSDFTATSHTYREYVSTDGGKTWVLYLTGRKTRLSAPTG